MAYSCTCLWNSTDQKNELKNDESRRFLFRFLNKEIKHFGSEAKNQEVKKKNKSELKKKTEEK